MDVRLVAGTRLGLDRQPFVLSVTTGGAHCQQNMSESQRIDRKAVPMAQSTVDQMARLIDERNAAVREYHMVMSERDSVHKEMERLQENLTEATKRAQGLEQEKRAAQDEVLRIKRDVTALQLDKERILRECYELRLKYNVSTKYSSKVSDDSHHQLQTPALSAIRSSLTRVTPCPGLRGRPFPGHSLPAAVSCSSLSPTRDPGLAALNHEIEAIRVKMSHLERDLLDSQNEAEMSKRRRDWAIAEKKKMGQEREAMKQLCESLRKERNQRDRELSKALVENEELKRQLNEAIQALNDHHHHHHADHRSPLTHETESPLSSSAACSSDPLILPTACSRDSAIYADLLDPPEADQCLDTNCKNRPVVSRQYTSPTHVVSRDSACATPHHMLVEKPKAGEVRDILISNKSIEPLGIGIFWNEKNGSIFVSAVSENSIAAQAGIQVGDQLLDINGVNMRCQATRKIASTVLCQTKKSEDDLKIRVQFNPDKFEACYPKQENQSGPSSPLPGVSFGSRFETCRRKEETCVQTCKKL